MSDYSWTAFIRELETGVDWDNPTDADTAALDKLLRKMYLHRGIVAERILEVTARPDLFDAYEPHMEYPRKSMDKFLLYMDPADRFRIRLHRFKTVDQDLGLLPDVHDHRWHFSSVLLAGSYKQVVYRVAREEGPNTAVLVEDKIDRYETGDVNSLGPQIAHCVTDISDGGCCTFFVRGKSLFKNNRVYVLRNNTYRELFGRGQQIKNQLAGLADAIAASV